MTKSDTTEWVDLDLDEIERLAEEWDPETGEVPGEALADDDWIRKRMLALAFLRAETNRLEEEVQIERDRVEARAAALIDPVVTRSMTLEHQLTQYHRAVMFEEQRRGVTKPRTMLPFMWGRLRSGMGRAKVVVHDAAAAVAFMRRHKMHEALTAPSSEWRVNLSKAPGLIGEYVDKFTGEVRTAVLAPNGTPVPGLDVVPGERWFKVDTEPLR